MINLFLILNYYTIELFYLFFKVKGRLEYPYYIWDGINTMDINFTSLTLVEIILVGRQHVLAITVV